MELEKKASASPALSSCFPAESTVQITAAWIGFFVLS